MKKLVSVLTSTIVASLPLHADTVLHFTSRLSPGVNVKIVAPVAENPVMPANGETILCVAGLAHTGESFRPLAQAIFADSTTGPKVSRVILLNYPERGGSGNVFGRKDAPQFGELTLANYATIVSDTLSQCQEQNYGNVVIVAHSMGGLVTQVLQNKLLSENTSLFQAYGVSKVTTLGSSTPSQIPDPVLESGFGVAALTPLVTTVPELGQIVVTNADYFAALFFTDLSSNFFVDPAQVVASNWESIESATVGFQTVGTSAQRPSVVAGIFAALNGTKLRTVFGSQDGFSIPQIQQALYEYLTGDTTDSGLAQITAADAVHDMFVIDPAAVVPFLGL